MEKIFIKAVFKIIFNLLHMVQMQEVLYLKKLHL